MNEWKEIELKRMCKQGMSIPYIACKLKITHDEVRKSMGDVFGFRVTTKKLRRVHIPNTDKVQYVKDKLMEGYQANHILKSLGLSTGSCKLVSTAIDELRQEKRAGGGIINTHPKKNHDTYSEYELMRMRYHIERPWIGATSIFEAETVGDYEKKK